MFAAILGMFTGSTMGIVANLATQLINIFTQKKKDAHEIALFEAETKRALAYKKANIEGAVELEESKAFTESQKSAGKETKLLPSYVLEKMCSSWFGLVFAAPLILLLGIIDVLKAAVRPGIVIYLGGMSYYLTTAVLEIVNNAEGILSLAKAVSLMEIIIYSVVHMTSTVFTWFFGDRRNAKFTKSMIEKKGLV